MAAHGLLKPHGHAFRRLLPQQAGGLRGGAAANFQRQLGAPQLAKKYLIPQRRAGRVIRLVAQRRAIMANPHRRVQYAHLPQRPAGGGIAVGRGKLVDSPKSVQINNVRRMRHVIGNLA